MSTNTAPAKLTVNLKALADNYRLFQNMTNAEVAGVVKANAYGTGAKKVFQTLLNEGCARFFVATPGEAIELRALNTSATLTVLGGVYKGAEEEYRTHHLVPVLNSLGEIERWSDFAKSKGEKLPAIIHFDTGMNRLGLDAEEAQRLLQDHSILEPLNLQMVMTHFACSDEKDHPLNDLQVARFAQIAREFPKVPKSLCNSSGLFRKKEWHYDAVRTGYALYGGNPTPETANPVRSVVDLSVRILQSRLGIKGESLGYGASHVLEKDTKLATVALGYADGFLRSGSNKAALFWNGQPCPILGRVSMDSIIADVGRVQGPAPHEGDWLEVLGPHQGVDALAKGCGTIGYEILTSFRHRVERVYIR